MSLFPFSRIGELSFGINVLAWVFELQITCIIYKLKLLISLIQLVETESVRILSSFVFSRWGICHQGSHLP